MNRHDGREDKVGGRRPRRRPSMLINHYSLLVSVEQLLGLSKLGLAAAYRTMTKPFNL